MIISNLRNVRKLFTHEDVGNIHKTLGILCLVHFTYRMAVQPIFEKDAQYHITAPILATLHFALSATSLIFHIPTNRIKGAPMIWPLFRLHSIIFATRSIIVMMVVWASQQFAFTRLTSDLAKGATVIGTLVAADIVTRTHKSQDTTMRDMPFPPATPTRLITITNFYYSISQILATLNTLYATTIGNPFMLLLPIQLAAFFMTLVRKGILTAGGWHILYALALGYNYYYGKFIDTSYNGYPYWLSAVAIAIFRFKFRTNKYVLWAAAIIIRCIN